MVARAPINSTIAQRHSSSVACRALCNCQYLLCKCRIEQTNDPHIVGAFHSNNKCWSNKGGGRASFKRRPSQLDVQEISHQRARFYMELTEEVIPKRGQPYLKLDCFPVQTFWVATQAKKVWTVEQSSLNQSFIIK